MRHNKNGKKLNRTASHRKALFANLATALLEHEQITTTLPKAKALRPNVEKIISIGREDSLAARRLAASRLKDPEVVKKLFTEIGPRYKKRPGGYTRILKAGYRYGDNAPLAVIELVDRNVEAKGAADIARQESKESKEVVNQ